MKGIDISEHNGYIDFQKVKNSGIDFVIIRIGWIGNKNNHTTDNYFEDYYKRAKEAGLKIGFYVYNYCNSIDTVKSGAQWVIDKIKGKSFDMPIFIDMEEEPLTDYSKQHLTDIAKEFCKYIENNNIKAGVYASLNWFNFFIDYNQLLTYKIWLAQYTKAQNHSAKFRVDLWQYSSNGSVLGITGRVDMNKCLNCQNLPETTEENKGGFEVKIYQNGSTKEVVYSDKNCTKEVGYLNAYETAECYGIVDNLAIVVYNVDKTNNKKVGFCKWLGGIK